MQKQPSCKKSKAKNAQVYLLILEMITTKRYDIKTSLFSTSIDTSFLVLSSHIMCACNMKTTTEVNKDDITLH